MAALRASRSKTFLVCFALHILDVSNGCASTASQSLPQQAPAAAPAPAQLPSIIPRPGNDEQDVPMQVFNEALQRAEGSGERSLDVVQVNETGLNDNATLSLISENDVEIPQPEPQVAPAAPPRILADVPRSLKSEPFGKLVFEGNGDLLSNPTFRMNCSPPVSWTFCQPTCGSGDQAVDIENAKENALADILSAINGAFSSLGLGPVPEANVNITYSPSNTLLDEFGEYFDRDGYRYRTINNAVRYRIQISAKGKVEENSIEVLITIRSTYALREQLWKKFVTRFASILTAEKHAFLYDLPTLVDAKRTNNFLFF